MIWSLTTDNSAISTPSLWHYFVTWYIIDFNIPKINYKLWGTDFQYSFAHWLVKPKDKSEARGCTSRRFARDFDLGSVARRLVSSNHRFQSDRNLYVSMVVNASWRKPSAWRSLFKYRWKDQGNRPRRRGGERMVAPSSIFERFFFLKIPLVKTNKNLQ